MEKSVVRFERDGKVGVLVFNCPERLNPLTIEFQGTLRQILKEVASDRSLRAVVLTGEGKGFCVGADLASLGPIEGDDRSLGERVAAMMDDYSNPLITDLLALPIPVVGAVNGAAAGAGVGLALAADVTIAAHSAYFYLPFIPRLGIVPDLGTTSFLLSRIGHARAMGLTLLGDRLSGEDAARWGLIWGSVEVDRLREEAMALAWRLANLPAHGAIEARRAYASAAAKPLFDQLRYERDRQRELIDRPEFAEGIKAFSEKREPRFD